MPRRNSAVAAATAELSDSDDDDVPLSRKASAAAPAAAPAAAAKPSPTKTGTPAGKAPAAKKTPAPPRTDGGSDSDDNDGDAAKAAAKQTPSGATGDDNVEEAELFGDSDGGELPVRPDAEAFKAGSWDPPAEADAAAAPAAASAAGGKAPAAAETEAPAATEVAAPAAADDDPAPGGIPSIDDLEMRAPPAAAGDADKTDAPEARAAAEEKKRALFGPAFSKIYTTGYGLEDRDKMFELPLGKLYTDGVDDPDTQVGPFWHLPYNHNGDMCYFVLDGKGFNAREFLNVLQNCGRPGYSAWRLMPDLGFMLEHVAWYENTHNGKTYMGLGAFLKVKGSSLQTVNDVPVMDEVRFVQIHPSMVDTHWDKIVHPTNPKYANRTLETRMRYMLKPQRFKKLFDFSKRLGKEPLRAVSLEKDAASLQQRWFKARPECIGFTPCQGAAPATWAVKVAKGDMRKVLDAVEAAVSGGRGGSSRGGGGGSRSGAAPKRASKKRPGDDANADPEPAADGAGHDPDAHAGVDPSLPAELEDPKKREGWNLAMAHVRQLQEQQRAASQQASGESGTEAPPSRAHAGPPRGMVEAPESRLVPGQTGTVGPTDFHGAANYACCMTLEAFEKYQVSQQQNYAAGAEVALQGIMRVVEPVIQRLTAAAAPQRLVAEAGSSGLYNANAGDAEASIKPEPGTADAPDDGSDAEQTAGGKKGGRSGGKGGKSGQGGKAPKKAKRG